MSGKERNTLFVVVVGCTIVNLTLLALELAAYFGRNTAFMRSIFDRVWQAENYGLLAGFALSIIGVWIRQPSRKLRVVNGVAVVVWPLFVSAVLVWHLVLDHPSRP